MPHKALPPRRDGHPPSEALIAERAAIIANLRTCPFDSRCTIDEQMIGGVPCVLLTPPAPRAHLIHFHGGGYRYSSPDRVIGFLSALAADSEIEMIVPAYSLAPEAPFPNALHEGRAVIDAVSADPDGWPLLIGGDSAGGGLALAALIAIRDSGAAIPAAGFLLSPWLDLALRGESMHTRAQIDPLTSYNDLRHAATLYLGSLAPDDPRASPLYADLRGLPALLIHAGDHEVLRNDATRLAEYAEAAGAPVQLAIWDTMWHVWHAWAATLPEGQAALAQIGQFVRQHLARASFGGQIYH